MKFKNLLNPLIKLTRILDSQPGFKEEDQKRILERLTFWNFAVPIKSKK